MAAPGRIRVNVKNVVRNYTCKYCGSLLLEGDGRKELGMYEVCLLNTHKGSVAGAPLTGEVW
jgi:hypothetical protein